MSAIKKSQITNHNLEFIYNLVLVICYFRFIRVRDIKNRLCHNGIVSYNYSDLLCIYLADIPNWDTDPACSNPCLRFVYQSLRVQYFEFIYYLILFPRLLLPGIIIALICSMCIAIYTFLWLNSF